MGEVRMAVQVNKGSRYNVHLTSLLFFTEILLLEKQQGCNMYLIIFAYFFVLPSLLHPSILFFILDNVNRALPCLSITSSAHHMLNPFCPCKQVGKGHR